MATITSSCEGITFLPNEPAGKQRPRARRRIISARWMGVATVGALAALIIMAIAVPLVRQLQQKACFANLKRLGLALQDYHNAHGHLPAPAITARDGTPLLSWRVALLPHLGYQSLYERFALDEPWDSAHNRALLAEMPAELACPAGPGRRAGKTGYLVVVGPKIDEYSVNTPFDASRGVDLREITDGTSNTLLVIETDNLVPWTKPDDLQWSVGDPVAELKNRHADGAHALFADGSVHFLRPGLEDRNLRALLTANGREIIGGG